MRFTLLTALAFLSTSALAVPNSPTEDVRAAGTISKRADNWCRVASSYNCYKSTSRNSAKVKVEGRDKISTEKNFGVRCTKKGQDVNGDSTWDYIPRWNC